MFKIAYFPIREINFSGWLVRIAETVYQWQARAEQRYRLVEMSNHELNDIGLDRAQVLAEAGKPFWRA
ncbi:MAG: DUF1127 domain-containing protein [Alphaproteobacteria bacterium]|jgi:uncharacterized protein YjiS (DUF1127 family)|nr:DUF1127 domain-containing protein [Alphaproteobacteria bacterium]MDP6565175.1 DUF1127 domain-containing protein [Alphaproteobacteria bacterium]MDP6812304.1 DUF1127 domain-containing protein [Alphaproteobacteria bacterium]